MLCWFMPLFVGKYSERQVKNKIKRNDIAFVGCNLCVWGGEVALDLLWEGRRAFPAMHHLWLKAFVIAYKVIEDMRAYPL